MNAFLALVLLAQPGAQPAAPRAVDARTVAAALQPRLPQRFGLDFALVAANAEDNLLILTFDVGPQALQTRPQAVIAAQLPQGFCAAAQARAALEGPMSLRADARLPGGQLVQGAVLERCPAATPAG